MDWSSVFPIIATFAGTILGAVGIGLAGWLTVKFNSLQNKAQTKADIEAAQNRLIALQKIGQLSSGYIEQTHKDEPPAVKQRLAVQFAQVIAPQYGVPDASAAEVLPNVLAGVALLPKKSTALDETPKG